PGGRRRGASHFDHLLEFAAAMERAIAARSDHRASALSKGAAKGLHADIVTHQQTGQPNEITNHFPDYNWRRARRSLLIEGRQQDVGGHSKGRVLERLEGSEIDRFEL